VFINCGMWILFLVVATVIVALLSLVFFVDVSSSNHCSYAGASTADKSDLYWAQ